MRNLLQNEELWGTVLDNNLPTGINAKQGIKAKMETIPLVDKINYVHIEDAEISKEVWNKLKVAFQRFGLT